MALATPLTQEYQEKFYSSLKNIEATCAYDVQVQCGMSIGDIFGNLIAFSPLETDYEVDNRRSLLADITSSMSTNDGAALLKTVKDAIISPVLRAHRVRGRPHNELSPVVAPIAQERRSGETNLRGSSKLSAMKSIAHLRRLEADSESDSDSDSDTDSEDGDEGAAHHHHHGHHKFHQHHRESIEDNVFTGALGFGASDDMCLYKNFDKLTEPCQSAIVDHFQLRQDYWNESTETSYHGHGHHLAFWLLVFAFVFFVRRVICGHRHHHFHQVRKIMDSIRANPSLKAAVEAEAGVAIPEPPAPCRMNKCLKSFLLILLSLTCAFFIAVSSLLISSSILAASVTVDPATGEAHSPSVAFAVFVAASVSAAEVGLFFFIVRGFYKKRSSSVAMVTVTSSAPSAPPASAAAASPRPASPRRSWNWVPSRFVSFLPSSQAAPAGYAPLMNDDSQHGFSEMVTVVRPVTPYGPYTGIVSTTDRPPEIIAAAAMPVSHVRMI